MTEKEIINQLQAIDKEKIIDTFILSLIAPKRLTIDYNKETKSIIILHILNTFYTEKEIYLLNKYFYSLLVISFDLVIKENNKFILCKYLYYINVIRKKYLYK